MPTSLPLAGVTVNLIQGGGVIGTAVTDANGEYYFSSDPDSDFFVDGFTPGGGEYTIDFVPPAVGNAFTDDATFGTVPWSELDFTTEETEPSAIGSNANPADGEYIFTVGGPGENDHTIDAGFIADAAFTVEKLIDDEGGVPEDNQVFEIEVAAVDFRGDPIDLGPSATLELEAGETSAVIEVPVGTVVEVSEANSADYRDVVITPAGPTLVAGTVVDPLEFTVTNTLFEDGRFSVDKTVSGSGAGTISDQRQFTGATTTRASACRMSWW